MAENFPDSPKDCLKGALEEVAQEQAQGILFGPPGSLEIIVAAAGGCAEGAGGNGDGGDRPSTPSIFSKPSWVKDAGSFVNWMKQLHEAFTAAGKIPTAKEMDEILNLAREYGVKIKPDPAHGPNEAPWTIPHVHFGDSRAHVPLPAGYRLPDWVTQQ